MKLTYACALVCSISWAQSKNPTHSTKSQTSRNSNAEAPAGDDATKTKTSDPCFWDASKKRSEQKVTPYARAIIDHAFEHAETDTKG
jgi:hypothetical protein